MDWYSLLSSYGYLLLFLVLLVEGQPFVIFTGFLISIGLFKFWPVILVGFGASALGDFIFYQVAYRWGRKIFKKRGRFLFLTPERIEKFETYFTNHGGKTIFLSKFVYGFGRNTLMVSGLLGRPYREYLGLNLFGCLSSIITFTVVGYFLGHSYLLLEKVLKGFGLVIIFLILSVLIWERLKNWRLNNYLNNLSKKSNDRK